MCSWLCLCKKGNVDKLDTGDKNSVCFTHLNSSQVCRRGWYCDMEVGWQLKDAVTKQFMPSFIKKYLEHFCTNHTMLYIECGSIYVFKNGKSLINVWNVLLIILSSWIACVYLLCTLTQLKRAGVNHCYSHVCHYISSFPDYSMWVWEWDWLAQLSVSGTGVAKYSSFKVELHL